MTSLQVKLKRDTMIQSTSASAGGNMKLVILYGSEGTGKLTVAQEIATRTDLKLFHNHVSIDVARTLYEYGTNDFNELSWKVRLAVFESAAKNQIPGVIFTWAYSHPDFKPLLDDLLATIRPFKVEIRFVFLHCSQSELERRITNSSRSAAGKIHTIEGLHKQQGLKNHVEIPHTNSLVIDNTNLTPAEAANAIIENLGLEGPTR